MKELVLTILCGLVGFLSSLVFSIYFRMDCGFFGMLVSLWLFIHFLNRGLIRCDDGVETIWNR